MKQAQKKRLHFLLGVFLICAGIVTLTIMAFYNQISFFLSPHDVSAEYNGRIIRLGGYVKNGSFQEQQNTYFFIVTDNIKEVTVHFDGALPPLFKEGQGIVVEGEYNNHVLKAKYVFAKHDETYMPQSVVTALKEKGQWQKKY